MSFPLHSPRVHPIIFFVMLSSRPSSPYEGAICDVRLQYSRKPSKKEHHCAASLLLSGSYIFRPFNFVRKNHQVCCLEFLVCLFVVCCRMFCSSVFFPLKMDGHWAVVSCILIWFKISTGKWLWFISFFYPFGRLNCPKYFPPRNGEKADSLKNCAFSKFERIKTLDHRWWPFEFPRSLVSTKVAEIQKVVSTIKKTSRTGLAPLVSRSYRDHCVPAVELTVLRLQQRSLAPSPHIL